MASLALTVVGGMIGGPLGALAGSLIGNLLFPQKIQGPRLQDLKLHTSSYGQMTPFVYGTMRVAGNVIDEQPELTEHSDTSGGKGGPEVTNYTYTASFAVRLCEGPIAGVRKIWANGRLIYDRSANSTTNNNLPITIYLGTEDQLPDPTLETIHGSGNVPAYRGVAYVVFTDLLLTDYGNTLPNLNFEVYTSAGEIPERISSFSPAANGDGATFGASYDTGTGRITVGTYINAAVGGHPQLSYSEHYFDIDGTEVGTPIVDQPLETAALGGNPCYITNAPIACFPVNDLNDLAWFVNGQPMVTLTSGGPTGRGVVLGNYLYCASTNETFERYPMSGGIPAPDPDISYNTGVIDGSIWGFGTGDNGRLYVYNDVGFSIREFDDKLTLLHTWFAADFPSGFSSSAINVNNGFVRYANMFAFSYGSGPSTLNLVSIAADDTLSLYPQSRTVNTPNYTYDAGPVITLSGGLVLGFDGVTSLDASPEGVTLGDIVANLSDRCGLSSSNYDVTGLPDIVDGYLINQQASGRDMIQPLRDAWFFDAVERDGKVVFVKRGGTSVVTIPDDDLAAHVDGDDTPPIIGLVRAQDVDIPAVVNVNYVNAAADYQTGTQTSRRQVTNSQTEVTLELQISMTDAKAKSVADTQLYMAEAERNQFTINVPRKYARYEPTDVITADTKQLRIVDKTEIRAGVIKIDGVASISQVLVQPTVPVSGSGFTTSPPTVTNPSAATDLVLLDIPLVSDADDPNGFYAAMQGTQAAWPGASLFKSADGGLSYSSIFSESTAQTVGTTTDVLNVYLGGNTFDKIDTVTVVLDSGTLSSATELAVLNGANMAVIGGEIIQFKSAQLVSANTYVLSDLLRGRRGTEWAMSHGIGERFVLLTAPRISQSTSELNAVRQYKPVTIGGTVAGATSQSFANSGNALKPYAPVLLGGGVDGSGNVTLNWTRRTRIGGAWKSFTDVPVSESSLKFMVQIWNGDYSKCARQITVDDAETVVYTSAQQVTDFGAQQQTIYFTVAQFGAIGIGFQARGTAAGAGGSNNDPLSPISPYQSQTSGMPAPSSLPQLNLSMGWASVRKLSSSVGTFTCANIVVASFTTPSSTADGVIGHIDAGEWIDQPTLRTACLSTVAGDFSGTVLGKFSRVVGQTPSVHFAVGTSIDGYPSLSPSTTYYYNIKNDDGNGACTCLASSCGIFVELQKPHGL